jgi:hypothetical protein
VTAAYNAYAQPAAIPEDFDAALVAARKDRGPGPLRCFGRVRRAEATAGRCSGPDLSARAADVGLTVVGLPRGSSLREPG